MKCIKVSHKVHYIYLIISSLLIYAIHFFFIYNTVNKISHLYVLTWIVIQLPYNSLNKICLYSDGKIIFIKLFFLFFKKKKNIFLSDVKYLYKKEYAGFLYKEETLSFYNKYNDKIYRIRKRDIGSSNMDKLLEMLDSY